MLVGPFIGSEAVAAGHVTKYQLRTRYTAVHRNVYVPKGMQLTATDNAIAAWLWSGRAATIAGMSAAVLHGAKWVDATLPAELNRAGRDKVDGIVLHSDALAAPERTTVRGLPVTSAARTAFDIGRRPGLTTAVVRLDALLRATKTTVPEVLALAANHRGVRGLVHLRTALELTDPGAESPQETRTRLFLVRAGLPPLVTQFEVFGQFDNFVARVDMAWPQYKIAVEFDGAQHWTDAVQYSRDIDRLADLEALGWIVIRVSSDMLRHRRSTILRRVREAFAQRGVDVEGGLVGRR